MFECNFSVRKAADLFGIQPAWRIIHKYPPPNFYIASFEIKEKMFLPSSTFALHVHRTNSYKTEKDQRDPGPYVTHDRRRKTVVRRLKRRRGKCPAFVSGEPENTKHRSPWASRRLAREDVYRRRRTVASREDRDGAQPLQIT